VTVSKTVVFDIDEVIAMSDGKDHTQYSEFRPNEPVISAIRSLRSMGHRIILNTARWEEDRRVTVKWLTLHRVPYSVLEMEKPLADLYVDDKAFRYREGDFDLLTKLKKLLE
jgi:hypothetical protein